MSRREFLKIAINPLRWFKSKPKPEIEIHYGERDEENQTIEIYSTEDGVRSENTIKMHYFTTEQVEYLQGINEKLRDGVAVGPSESP